MITEAEAPIILRLGGTVISHSNKKIDYDYLREFRDLLREQILRGKKFVVIMGGGQTCREYQDLARDKGNSTSDRDLHWIGASVNTLHAIMVRAFFGDEIAEDKVWKFDDVDKLKEQVFSKPVVLVGGFVPGVSSDWCALQIAKAWGAKQVFDLKGVDGVYDADPRENPKAKYFPKLTWDKYMQIIGNPDEHKPGGHFPVDPIAAKDAKALGTTYYIIKATDFVNLENAINGDEFHGTVISA